MNRAGPALLHMLGQYESEIRRIRSRFSNDRREIGLIAVILVLLASGGGYFASTGASLPVLAVIGLVSAPLAIRAIFLSGRAQSMRKEHSAIATMLGSMRIAIDDTVFSESDLQQIAEIYRRIDTV